MMAAKGSRNSQAFPGHSHAYLDIGFTDSSNPFYLFSKLNVGLLLWAPFASTMREEHPLLIALEADRRIFMPRIATAKPRDVSSLRQIPSFWIATLTVDDRLTDLQIARSKFVDEHGCFTVGGH